MGINYWKFFVYQVVSSRYYRHLVPIYFLSIPGTDVNQIWWFITTAMVSKFVFEVPSGYLGDRIGHRNTLIIAQFCMLLCVSLYALGHAWLFTVGAIIMALGQSLMSGTAEAYFYEILEDDDEHMHFGKKWSQLKGNAGLVGILFFLLFPWLASYNLSIPFRISAVMSLVGIVVAFFLTIPTSSHNIEEDHKSVTTIFHEQRGTGTFIIIFFFAIIGGLYLSEQGFRELYFLDIGLALSLLGLVLGGARVCTWVFAHTLIPRVDRFSLKNFMMFDFLCMGIGYVLVSMHIHFIIILVFFTILRGYRQSRRGMIKKFLLGTLKDRRYKATLLSAYGQAKDILGAILVIPLGYMMDISYHTGFLVVGISLLVILSIYMVIFWKKIVYISDI